MARSQKDDPLYNNMQHPTWNYHENIEKCTNNSINELNHQPPRLQTQNINDNMFGNANNFANNDVYTNKLPYINTPSADNSSSNVDNLPLNSKPAMNCPNNVQNYGNAMLNLGNGQVMRVYYDENNQQIMIPVTGQYELFNQNQGLHDISLQAAKPSHMFTINQDSLKNTGCVPQSVSHMQTPNYSKETPNPQGNPKSSFLNEVWGNWEPSVSGTYSPFGQNYPLNHPDAPLNMVQNPIHPIDLSMQQNVSKPENISPKRNVNTPLAETANKKRIVAEVKPMRPSYSDVLAKNAKNNSLNEANRKPNVPNPESKVTNTNKTNKTKHDKATTNNTTKNTNDEKKDKGGVKKLINTTSSGSESGDVNNDEHEKREKPPKKAKNKENLSRKWSSIEDVSNDATAGNSGKSQFIFIEKQDKPKKDRKSNDKTKQTNKNEESPVYDGEEEQNSSYQDNQAESTKTRKKKENRSYIYKTSKPSQDKKKTTQSKWKKNKPGYIGVVQNYLDHWWGVTWKAVVWFLYLVLDIIHMSAHLSFDICTSAFTQTYVSSQAVWRSGKDAIRKLPNNKYLQYIDKKFGHTRLGFWRKLRWFKKEVEVDDSEATKLNTNIPLPATGDEAMKRLLACKGKDPYSILGVSESCSDEDIKRYYRRQAFLVHPDKNQTPGAEEAFKILQHAFDIIGEPERRALYGAASPQSAAAAAAARRAAAAWGELSDLLAQLHDKMEFANNTIRCTNCGRRHKRVLTSRPCYAARYCAVCNIRHSAKEGDIWAESSMLGLLVMYYACMDGGVYQITQWASCQKKNLKQLRADCHVVQYRIVLGNKAAQTQPQHDPNLEEFLNTLYNKTGPSPPHEQDKKKRTKKNKNN